MVDTRVSNTIHIREFLPGDPSLVVHLHMMLYQRQYGFKGIFEHYVMAPMAEFIRDHTGSQLWVAVDQETVVGSIAVVRSTSASAQLRWFAVEDGLQGQGIGSRLMETALRFCRDHNYMHIQLWTIDMLDAARHLYQREGFRPTETKENREWTDNILIEEKWERWG